MELFKNDTVSEFTNEPIENDKKKAILKAAMNASSAGHQNPWEFYVITDSAMCEKLSHCGRAAAPTKDAPFVIVPCYKKRVKFQSFVLEDMAACCQNICLEANHLGFGAYWVGVAPRESRMDMVANALTLPRHLQPFAIICIGKPKSGEIPQKPNTYDPELLHFIGPSEDEFE